jgi:hypothetical protein
MDALKANRDKIRRTMETLRRKEDEALMEALEELLGAKPGMAAHEVPAHMREAGLTKAE